MSAPPSPVSPASESDSTNETPPDNTHARAIHALTYAPDGKHIATAHADGALRIWDAKSLQQVGADLQGHTARVSAVAYSPDNRRLLSASDDGTVRMWSAETHKEVLVPGQQRMGHASAVYAVACSPDGRLVASGGADRVLHLWDAVSRECLATIRDHSDAIRCVAFSPDSKHLATASDDRLVRVFNLEQRRLAIEPIAGHKAPVRCVAFSPDGTLLASASSDHTVRIHDAASGKLHKGPLRGHSALVASVAFSADGRRVLTGSDDRTVCVWDVPTEKIVLGPLYGHDAALTAAFSPDGKQIATGDVDCVLRVWDAGTGKALLPPPTKENAKRDRARKASAAKGMHAYGRTTALAWLPDAHHFATAGPATAIRIWNAATGVSEADGDAEGAPVLWGHTGPVTALAVSRDGALLVSGSVDASVRLWAIDAGGGVVKGEETAWSPLRGHKGPVGDVRVAPDGERVVSCCAVDVAVNNAAAAAAADDEDEVEDGIRIWDARTGTCVAVLERSRAYTSLCLFAFTDTRAGAEEETRTTRLAAGSALDKAVSVWDLDTRHKIAGPFTHETSGGGGVVRVGPAHGGASVLSTARDGRVCAWAIASGAAAQTHARALLTTEKEGGRSARALGCVDWASDGGRLLGSVERDKAVCIWGTGAGAVGAAGAGDARADGNGSADVNVKRIGTLVHAAEVDCAVFSPDGKRVLTACKDGTLWVWDVEAGRVVLPRASEGGSEEEDESDSADGDDDESFMNMPAAPRNAATNGGAAPAHRGFFDDDDFDGPAEPKRELMPVRLRASAELATAPRRGARRRGLIGRSVGAVAEKFKMRMRSREEGGGRGSPKRKSAVVSEGGTRAPAGDSAVVCRGERASEVQTGGAGMRRYTSGYGRRRSTLPQSGRSGPSSPAATQSRRVRRPPSVESEGEDGSLSPLSLCACLPFCR
ncbi:WD40 repeat-like protein [Coniophora puteana RWD-64-598 SS2]|uniref:WD40 repeat-like protein n=1 Tax=Coniophora puteana (strain RWD-64-598) TaxID=741705 RepID=A0A5M3MCK3_CONPW|nr:WD40 repeat-like protein [Coniophora puteana RWD-64-598 SS2]EIW76938.1 WD40 repeat-like protein [Coniophora puteana RWD-64-598 SS2]